jgi:hypothetical protein
LQIKYRFIIALKNPEKIAPKEIIQNKYLQHLTTAHWTCSTAAAVGSGHYHCQLLASSHLRNFLHSSILQLVSLFFENCVSLCSCYFFLGLRLLIVCCLNVFFTSYFLQAETLPAAKKEL